jgi:hypothetical protein
VKLPRFTDLRGMARDLGDDPVYRRLATTIGKAARAQSCASDLAQARTAYESLDALLASPRKKGSIERSATENALLMTAVLLYARATSTSGGKGERGSIDISSKLNDGQLLDHKALVDVRNRALAHVYSREPVADDLWHADQLFLVETEQGWKPAAATKRYQFHRPTLDRLHRQVPVASELVTETFHKHTNRITELLSSNPVELSLFERTYSIQFRSSGASRAF